MFHKVSYNVTIRFLWWLPGDGDGSVCVLLITEAQHWPRGYWVEGDKTPFMPFLSVVTHLSDVVRDGPNVLIMRDIAYNVRLNYIEQTTGKHKK